MFQASSFSAVYIQYWFLWLWDICWWRWYLVCFSSNEIWMVIQFLKRDSVMTTDYILVEIVNHLETGNNLINIYLSRNLLPRSIYWLLLSGIYSTVPGTPHRTQERNRKYISRHQTGSLSRVRGSMTLR